MHMVAIGGSDAGISAALRAGEVVLVIGPDGGEDVIAYDQLVIGTGA
jgi:hypothetical protein